MNQNTINIKIEPIFHVFARDVKFDIKSLDEFCEKVRSLPSLDASYHLYDIDRYFFVMDVDMPEYKDTFNLSGGYTMRAQGQKKHTLNNVMVMSGRISTVKDLINVCDSRHVGGCKLCNAGRNNCPFLLPENQDKPAFWDRHNICICYLNPDKHIVVSQQDCRQLFPTPDEKHPVAPNGMPQKLADFFNTPINVSLGLNMASKQNVR